MRRHHLILVLVACLSVAVATAAAAGERVALAIGISAYRSQPLPSPARDATEVADALSRFGYQVTLAKDLNSEDFRAAVSAFVAKARGAEAAIVYFSGHGLQVNGEVYMLASDTRMDRPEAFQRDDFTVNGILDRLQAAGVDFKFVIVDACRNNPFLDAGGRASAAIANAGRAERRRPVTNALVSFASASGQPSQDWGRSIGLSLYTSALLEVMRRNARIEVRDLTLQTRVLVEQRIASRGGNAQNPWEGSSLIRPMHLERGGEGGSVVAYRPGRRQDYADLEAGRRYQPRGERTVPRMARPADDGEDMDLPAPRRSRSWEHNRMGEDGWGGQLARGGKARAAGRYDGLAE